MIDIVIVNWNSGNFIKDCISSINNYSNGLIKQIIVIDNNSTDYSDISIKGMPNVNLIKLESNYGFAKACNIGSSYSKSKYILFLNPDTIINPGVFERVFKFMEDEHNSDIGICGVQQINNEGAVSKHSNNFPTIFSFLYVTVGLATIFPKLGHEMNYWNHMDSRQVDHVIGSFYFIRRKVFKKAKGFDERFFVYLEDLDLSYRVKKMGWKSMYLSDVNIKHYCGGSSRNAKSNRLFYSIRSRLLYVEKHFGKSSFFIILLATFTFELSLRLIKALASFSLTIFREILMSYLSLAKWFFKSQNSD